MSSTTAPAPHPSSRRSIGMLIAQLAIVAGVAALGSLTTIASVDGWYASAAKVAWTPPNVVFGPVWTVLYTLMAVAAWLLWRERDRDPVAVRRALGAYVVQLVLNALWTPVFFGLYPFTGAIALWLALAIIVALDVALILTVRRAAAVRPLAAGLLAPYLVWVLFATTLNLGDAILNR